MRYLPRSYCLLMIGEPIEPMYAREIKQYVRDNGMDNIVFPGKVKHDAIPTHLATFTCVHLCLKTGGTTFSDH